uniref:MAM domain containing 2a n=1 Tax=Neogobius melanostomus TaxID=47308 RepID=A0A8C6TNW7_9GOBI
MLGCGTLVWCTSALLLLLLQSLGPLCAQLLSGSCNFELGTCGYTSDPHYGSWDINEEGHLISMDWDPQEPQERAVLLSPVLEQPEWSCVRLVYQLTGNSSLLLHLRPQHHNFDHTLWEAHTASDSWLIASVDLPNSTQPYQILLEGRLERVPESSVAIFEIHIVPGYCIACNFEEHHLCGYSNSWNPNVNWYVGGSLPTESNLLEAQGHHPHRGHYMYVDSVYAKQFQEVAYLSSPMTTAPMSGCLSFFYLRNQARGNLFSVFTRDQLGHYEELWMPKAYVSMGWTYVSVDIKAPHPLEVVFEVAFNSPRGGSVAIDEISFSPEFCHNDTEPDFDPSVANCDFEEGLCLYSLEFGVWSRRSVKANMYRIGDHTTGTGSFLQTHAPFTSLAPYMDRLHGPLLPGNTKYCLTFFYLLNGFRKLDHALSVYIYDENNVALEKVWSLADASRTMWHKVDLTYTKPMLSKVVFVSLCRTFWECGSVALDDISVSVGDCQITSVSLPAQCDFERDMCGYFQEKEDSADWLRVRAVTPTSYTGPRGDHSTGVGYFVYIEASLMRPGHRARLLSPLMRGSSSAQCLVFHYHMYGSGTGILRVLLRRSGQPKDSVLWRRAGEQGVSWMRATVDYNCNTAHQIVFEATRGPSLRSDISLDDIEFKHGPCEDLAESYSGFSENFNDIESY